MLSRVEWLLLPQYQDGRRLTPTGPYLGDLFVPPGQYGVYIVKDGYQRAWKDVTLSADAGLKVLDFQLLEAR